MANSKAKYPYNKRFLKIQDENYWYIAGLLASDGYISDEAIELTLNQKDLHILEQIRDIVCPTKPIYHKPKYNAYTLKLNNYIWAKHFKNLFSMTSNRKHDELNLPDIPKIYLKDFVRGYIDGDGSIGNAKAKQIIDGEMVFYYGTRLRILGNEKFLTQLIEKIRGHVPNKTFAVCKKGKENVYVVTYNFSIADKILKWIYSEEPELYLKRKFETFQIKQLKDIV